MKNKITYSFIVKSQFTRFVAFESNFLIVIVFYNLLQYSFNFCTKNVSWCVEKKTHNIKNPPWKTISIDNYQEVVNYGLEHKKISKLKLIYAQHNNLFMAYLLVWAVSFCRRFFCPLYPRILKAFLLGIRWSWKIDELCEKGGKNVSFFVIFNS